MVHKETIDVCVFLIYLMVGGKKGNRTEPNRTNGLYRTEPTEISDNCGTGFYLRHRTKPTNAILTILILLLLVFCHTNNLNFLILFI